MKLVGQRIKKNREKIGMSLSELAKRVGVSVSCLSQIENIKSFPSIFTLKKIADMLNTTVGNLIGENERLSDNPLVKNADKKFVEKIRRGMKLYLLSHHDPNKQMEAFFIKLNKNALIDNFMEKHPGQTFIYLLKGEIEITLNDKEYNLKKYCSFYIKSKGLVKIKNNFNGISEALYVITP